MHCMLDALVALLSENVLLLLFVITGIGHLLGRLRFGNFSLGASGILFAGLAFGALHPDFRLPGVVYQFGLALFVYMLGLSAGPAFFSSLRRRGLRVTAIVGGSLLLATGIAIVVGRLLGLSGPVAAGTFVGSLTSTPALAAALEYIAARAPIEELENLRALPVVGYSLSYPIGVLGVILAMHWAAKLLNADVAAEAQSLAGEQQSIVITDVEVMAESAFDQTISQLFPKGRTRVVVSRLLRGDKQMTVDGNVRLASGDVVTLVGPKEDVQAAVTRLGRLSGLHPHLDRSQIDVRRIIVSNKEIAGRRIRDLDLRRRFGATISRIRRGDVEVVPTADLILELGDQVRVVAPSDRLDEVGQYLGDSYRNLGEIDIISISLGVALGLLVGTLSIPLPGGFNLQLGFAGGPLLVALILGYLGRTGRILWILPHNVNVTLRELGLLLFLAGIGTQAGNALTGAVSLIGWQVVIASVAIALSYSFLTLIVGYKWFKVPMPIMYGLLAGIQTQSVAVAYANERAGNDQANIPYAMAYPTAMVLKILLSQVMIHVFGLGLPG